MTKVKKQKKRIEKLITNTDIKSFWWSNMDNKRKSIEHQLAIGRSVEEEAMRLLVDYYIGKLPDGTGNSDLLIMDAEDCPVIQSLKADFVAGHAIWPLPFKKGNKPSYSQKFVVSVKKLATSPNGHTWTNGNSIYISKNIWNSKDDHSSHMIVGNDDNFYFINTDKYKMDPRHLCDTSRPNYIKINIQMGMTLGFVKDLINDKYIK